MHSWRRPFFFLGDHQFLAKKTLWISDFGRKKPSNFGEDLFFWRSPKFDRKTDSISFTANENLDEVRLRLYQTSKKAPLLCEILATRPIEKLYNRGLRLLTMLLAGFTLRGAPGTLEIFAKFSLQILVTTKKSLTIWDWGPWHCATWQVRPWLLHYVHKKVRLGPKIPNFRTKALISPELHI